MQQPRFSEKDYQKAASADPQSQNSPEAWNTNLENGILSDAQLESLDVKERPLLIEPWCREGDLGFIFASRGIGKTWLGMHIAHCLSSGHALGIWKVPFQEHKILYIDGEMALSDVKYRNHVLRNSSGSHNLFYLNHERLFEQTQSTLNLSNVALQLAIEAFCIKYAFGVLILDNLSCLVSGIDENSAIDWEKILPWLLGLRRNKITVIFIHHAGREGFLRGHSKREDPANWIMQLKLPKNDPDHEVQGASFISSFQKYRNAPERPTDLLWNFSPINNGSDIVVQFEECNQFDLFLDLVLHGSHECNQIAEDMNISRATVCRLALKAEQKGLIEIKKRRYYIKCSEPKGYKPYSD